MVRSITLLSKNVLSNFYVEETVKSSEKPDVGRAYAYQQRGSEGSRAQFWLKPNPTIDDEFNEKVSACSLDPVKRF